MAVHRRTCPLCEAMCGLLVSVEGDRVTRIRGNPDHVWSRGYLCPKGTALGDLHHDPDRVRVPLVREQGGFREASWSEAFERVAHGIQGAMQRYGARAVTAYIGNPTVHNFSLSRYVPAFVALSGLPVIYSAGTVDQWPQNLVAALLYGGMWSLPTVDLDRTSWLLMLGANPRASQGSLLAAPDLTGRLDAIRRRGGRVVVVDPRRTGTCRHASEWIPIRPGTDAAWLLAIAQVLFEEGRVRLDHLEGRVAGVEELRRLCAPFTPEGVAGPTRIPPETTRRIARELSEAPAAAVYGRIGICTQEFGTLASWMVEVLNILTGNLDREGGRMWSDPVAWSLTSLPDPAHEGGVVLHRYRSRVRGVPEVLGQFPVSCLIEEIETPGEGQVRALIVIAGNPAVSIPGADRLDAALDRLDFMVSVDNYVNETSRHADVILPGLSALEQPHYDELLWSFAIRNCASWSPALFDPGDRPAEWEILLTLAALCQGARPGEIDVAALDQLFFAGLVGGLCRMPGSRIQGRDPQEIVDRARGRGPERLLDLTLRTGPHGDLYGARPGGLSLEEVARHPDGLDFGPLRPRLDEVLRTPSGRIELVPEAIVSDLPRLAARLRDPAPPLVLVSRRDLRSNNSWMHNLPRLMAGRDRCTLLLHPRDAERAGVRDGELVRVRSAAGSVEAPVEVSDEMMPGVACLPHGWGHDRPGVRMRVARARPGVCNNVLAPVELVDRPSGNAVVNGIPIELERVEGA